jgi:hypothetical protein
MVRPFVKSVPPLALLAIASLPLRAQTPSAGVTARIRDEGLNRSQVMQTLSYLTDVIGPRLTGSPNLKRANEWTRDTLTKWGLQNAHLEAWGPFGRGWSLERFSAQIVEPQCIPLIGFPKAWSQGLGKGVKTADVVYVDIQNEQDFSKYKGKLKGAIVLSSPLRQIPAHFEPLGARYTDEQLEAMAAGRSGRQAPGQPRPQRPALSPEMRAQFQMAGQKTKFFYDEGVLMIVDAGRGDGGTFFVQSASLPPAAGGQGPGNNSPGNGAQTAPSAQAGGQRAGRRQGGGTGFAQGPRRGPWAKDAPKTIPQITLAAEHYNRLVRMIQQGEKLKMAVELDVKFYDKDEMAYNTVAEIPGTDPALKDEVVVLGAHLDSWHSGTGATDNGAGVAACMEAVRILKALDLKPRRTIRIALWSGEEEGLFGSRAYVAEHFGSWTTNSGSADLTRTLTKKPDYDKFAGYFNLDNGTGKIRGIYLQGNESCRPIFTEWLQPFSDLGAKTVTINNTGGTDHQSFDAIGLPGFQFIQDEIEYETRTHHSNQDLFDRIQADDMKQASVIMASFVYNTAMRDEKLPHKPAPQTNGAF